MSTLQVIFSLIEIIFSFSFNLVGIIIIGFSLWKLFNSLNIKPYYGLIPFYNIWLISKKSKQKHFIFEIFMISLISQTIYSGDIVFFGKAFFTIYDFISLILVSTSLICWTILAINFS